MNPTGVPPDEWAPGGAAMPRGVSTIDEDDGVDDPSAVVVVARDPIVTVDALLTACVVGEPGVVACDPIVDDGPEVWRAPTVGDGPDGGGEERPVDVVVGEVVFGGVVVGGACGGHTAAAIAGPLGGGSVGSPVPLGW